MSRGFGAGGGGPFANLMKQASQMQSKIGQLQESLKEKIYDASSGGGMVSIVITGAHEIKKLVINPEVAGDTEMLADLVVVAYNEALKKSQDEYKSEMNKITGGMNFPGM